MSDFLRKLPMEITDDEIANFIAVNCFKFDYRIDPQIHCFVGTHLTLCAADILQKLAVSVYFYVVDNSDFGQKTTFKVELLHNNKVGSSSPFCDTIDQAYKQAAMDLLFRLKIEPRPTIVAWQHRKT